MGWQWSQKGWLLVGLIVILSSVFVAMGGISLALAESRRSISLTQNQTEAVYLAQAGVMQALYDFRGDAGITLNTQTVDPGPAPDQSDDDIFKLDGKAADFLLVNMIPASWGTAGICGGASNRQRLQGWALRNVLRTDSTLPTPPDNLPDGMPVVIVGLEVRWDPDNGERVYRIDLMGNAADWTSCTGAGSGEPIPLTQTVNPNTRGPGRIWFSRRTTESSPPSLLMNNKNWIEIRFTMSDHVASGNPLDASIRVARFIPAAPATSVVDFTLKSIGEVRKGPFPFVMWRRLQAEYRVCGGVTDPVYCNAEGEERTSPANLSSYQELAQRTP